MRDFILCHLVVVVVDVDVVTKKNYKTKKLYQIAVSFHSGGEWKRENM